MVPEHIILHAHLESCCEEPALGSAHRAVVMAHLFRESASAPPLHPGRHYGDVVDSPALDWHIAADLFETSTAEHLAGARNMLDVHKAVVVDGRTVFLKGCPHKTQLRIRREFTEQKSEVIWIEGDVTIETCDGIIVQRLHAFMAEVECVDLTAEGSL